VAYIVDLFGRLPVVAEEYKENLMIRGCATDIQTAHVRIEETLLLEQDTSVRWINNRFYRYAFQLLHCVFPSGYRFNEAVSCVRFWIVFLPFACSVPFIIFFLFFISVFYLLSPSFLFFTPAFPSPLTSWIHKYYFARFSFIYIIFPPFLPLSLFDSLYLVPPTFLWQRTTDVTVGCVAGRTWTNNKWCT
jgi:hypothetical protein